MIRHLAAAGLVALACSRPDRSLIRVERHPEPGGVRLVLRAQPGARINARLKPALELTDGAVLRFDAAGLSADSAYFEEPPALLVPSGQAPRGRVRASVCPLGTQLCRLVELDLS